MPLMKVKVRIVIEPDDEGFHAYCPDLKGLHVDGETMEEAIKNAKDAVSAYLISLLQHNEPIPVGILEEISFGKLARKALHKILPTPKRSFIEEITLQAA